MNTNIFELSTEDLRKIADKLQEKIEEGLKEDGMEIKAIPTYIYPPDPKKPIEDGKVLALDWGGKNFRASIITFKNGEVFIEMKTRVLNAEITAGFKPEDLHKAMAATIGELEGLDKNVTKIGYTFSYPAKCESDGDATLIEWTKDIDIPDMVGKRVGKLLLADLNKHFSDKGIKFDSIKVINDTVACLFAGLSKVGYDSYIGLIVGTGTNMACMIPSGKITKPTEIKDRESGKVIINLESGNFSPDNLTAIDAQLDAKSANEGKQKFEKAVSGKYLVEIFKLFFPDEKFEDDFDTEKMEDLIFSRKGYEKVPEEQVKVAEWIRDRSALLVAASLAGVVQVIVEQEPKVKKFCLAAEGPIFWKWKKNKDDKPHYKVLVDSELKKLLPEGVTVDIITPEMTAPNLIGAAIAAVSPSAL